MMIVGHAIHTIYKVCCLKKSYNKPLINFDRLVITGKYQTLVGHAIHRYMYLCRSRYTYSI